MTSLSDKEVCYNNLICFPHKDVKEAIKQLNDLLNYQLKLPIDKNDNDFNKCFHSACIYFKEKIEDKLGADLCSEVEE